jgi:ankyrin repeat protein
MLLARWGPDDPIAQRALDQVLAAGPDVLAKDDKGQTAEDWAILYHREDLAERLRKMRKSMNEKQ